MNLVLAAGGQDRTAASREIEEAVADKGYHKAEMLAECEELNTRTYIPEPKGGSTRRATTRQSSGGRRRRTGGG